jgi:hypothetical protein
MDCNENWEKIGDYVDGTLEHTSAVAFDAHLATCARCRSIVADLRSLRAATLALEPQAPPVHAWARLSRAIEAEPRPPAWRSWMSGGVFAWAPLASAAMLLLLVSGLSWIGGHLAPGARPVNETAGNQASGNQASPVATEPVALDGSVGAEFRLAEAQYATAIASLEDITRSDATELDDHTADVLRSSVEAIDEAIGESRAALENEPTNQLAQDSLFDALRSKVALLQDTMTLINEMRQSDQARAAGVGPGLHQ